jgi:hypothetical protein
MEMRSSKPRSPAEGRGTTSKETPMLRWTMAALVAALLMAGSPAAASDRDFERAARFAVVHGEHELLGWNEVQSLGTYEGTREGAAIPMVVKAAKQSYTSRGTFQFSVWTEAASDEEARRVGNWPGYHTTVVLSLEEYAAIFHGPGDSGAFTVRNLAGHPVEVTVEVEGGRRVVDCRLFTDQGSSMREYGRLILGLRGGVIVDAALMMKCHGLFGWRTVLDVRSSNQARTAKGLALEDTDLMGHLTDVAQMRRILAEPTATVFSEVASR